MWWDIRTLEVGYNFEETSVSKCVVGNLEMDFFFLKHKWESPWNLQRHLRKVTFYTIHRGKWEGKIWFITSVMITLCPKIVESWVNLIFTSWYFGILWTCFQGCVFFFFFFPFQLFLLFCIRIFPWILFF